MVYQEIGHLTWIECKQTHADFVYCIIRANFLSGKILIIGGGIANFTNVSATFSVSTWNFIFVVINSFLEDKSGVDKIIVKKQPYQLLNTSLEFFPIYRGSNFHKFDDQSSVS